MDQIERIRKLVLVEGLSLGRKLGERLVVGGEAVNWVVLDGGHGKPYAKDAIRTRYAPTAAGSAPNH